MTNSDHICYACKSPAPLGGFCSSSCKEQYIALQLSLGAPATGVTSPHEDEDMYKRWCQSSSTYRFAQPRAARPDPRLEGENLGWWDNAVRALESDD